MKQALALLATFLFFVIAATTIGIAQAHPRNAPQLTTTLTPSNTPTPSFTPTETTTASATPTETATATATTNPCEGHPAAPNLVKPKNKTTTNNTQLILKWTRVECATNYRILIRKGSNNGDPVMRGSTKKIKVTTVNLARGLTYYWNIKACIKALCTRSKTWTFTISAPPTPTRRPTTPGGGNGTPVPGNPPGNLVNYYSPDRGGVGVYLYNAPNTLFRFECARDANLWRQFGAGATMYNIALWYYPNESISYERLDFNIPQVVENKTLYANSEGYVEYAADTSSWTPNHHYHLIFTGSSSGVQYCGHFDIQSAGAPIEPLAPNAHDPREIERLYRAAGVTIPHPHESVP